MEGYTEVDGKPLSYCVRAFLVNSKWYGLPQNRERVYLVGIKSSGDTPGTAPVINPKDFLGTVQAYLSKMQVNPPPAELFLLPDDSEPVVRELQRLEAKFQTGAGATTGESSERSQAWVKQHMSIAERSILT